MAGTSGTRLRPGDVLQVECDARVGLLSFVGRHSSLGDLTWVLPTLFHPPVRDVCAAFQAAGYFQFYPATTAVRRGLIQRAGYCVEAMKLMPPRLLNIIAREGDGLVHRWTISDGTSRVVRTELSPEERELPVAVIINHEALLDRLREGWTPARYHPAG